MVMGNGMELFTEVKFAKSFVSTMDMIGVEYDNELIFS